MPTKVKNEARIDKLRTEFSERPLTQVEMETLVKADTPPIMPPTMPPIMPPIMPAVRGETIRQEYAEWLQGYNWDYFLTSTFRRPRKEPYYALQSVWHELEKSFVSRAFLGVEPHQSGDLHVHGIVSGRGAGFRPDISLPWDIWTGLFKRFGRAKVEACNSREAVTAYCAKYLLKQQSRVCDYYEVFGNRFAWRDGLDLQKGGESNECNKSNKSNKGT